MTLLPEWIQMILLNRIVLRNNWLFFEKYSDIDVVGAWIDEFEDDISEVSL